MKDYHPKVTCKYTQQLILKVLVMTIDELHWTLLNRIIIAQWEGMGM